MAHGVVAQADRAVEEGDYVKAVDLYSRASRRRAATTWRCGSSWPTRACKIDKSSKRLQDALAIYEGILNQYPGRTDVRRRAAETAVEMAGGCTRRPAST